MPKRIPVLFGYETVRSDFAAGSRRSCVNLRPEPLPEGSKAPMALYRSPGIATIPFTTGLDGPIRGMEWMGGALYVVAGANLYRVDVFGAATSLGALSGAPVQVTMCTNGTQLTIAHGSGLMTVWNGTTLAEVTDVNLPDVAWVEAFDQYTVYGRLDGEGWGVSAIGDSTDYDPLDVASAESSPDKILRGLRNGREILLFGESTVEPFYNAVNGAGFPFERSSDGIIEVGLAAKFSPARIDNTVYFLGTERGGLSVRRLDGRTPVRVSQPGMDSYLDRLAATYGVSLFSGFGYSYGGHSYYVLSNPASGDTFALDIGSQKWITRTSAPAHPMWQVNTVQPAFGALVVGDAFVGRLGKMDVSVNSEYGAATTWETVCAPVQFEQRALTHAKLELELDSNPKATVRTVSMAWSDNDGQTWSNEYPRSPTTYVNGRNRCTWTNLGSSVSRLYRFKGADVAPIGLIRAFADVEVGG